MSADELDVVLIDGGVAIMTLQRPPHNFLDTSMVSAIADAIDAVQGSSRCIVLRSEGRNFSAGRDFRAPRGKNDEPEDLYREAARLFARNTPLIAAVRGAAVGAGLGLALAADLRVVAPDSRFEAPFAKLGTQQGFGITRTLPTIVGQQAARRMLLTADPVYGTEAVQLGLADYVEPGPRAIDDRAIALARQIAAYPHDSLSAIRDSLAPAYEGLADVFVAEAAAQRELRTQRS